jgi:hypothetical protein
MAHTPKNLSTETARCSRPAQRTNSITRCFIAMRKNGLTFSARRASGVILPMIAALLLLAAAPRVGWGQFCPPGADGPYNVFESVGGCTIGIEYCINCTTGQITIQDIAPAAPGCSVWPVGEQMEQAIAAMIQDPNTYQNSYNLDGTHADPCPSFIPDLQMYGPCMPVSSQITISTCWEFGDNSPSANLSWVYPCPETSACVFTYTVCWNSVTNSLYLSSENWTGEDGDCTIAPPWGSWVENTCYAVDPCDY